MKAKQGLYMDLARDILAREGRPLPALTQLPPDFYQRTAIEAVSYTHLDVYKRQVYAHSRPLLPGLYPGRSPRQAVGDGLGSARLCSGGRGAAGWILFILCALRFTYRDTDRSPVSAPSYSRPASGPFDFQGFHDMTSQSIYPMELYQMSWIGLPMDG